MYPAGRVIPAAMDANALIQEAQCHIEHSFKESLATAPTDWKHIIRSTFGLVGAIQMHATPFTEIVVTSNIGNSMALKLHFRSELLPGDPQTEGSRQYVRKAILMQCNGGIEWSFEAHGPMLALRTRALPHRMVTAILPHNGRGLTTDGTKEHCKRMATLGLRLMSVHEPREGAVNAAQREVLDAADGALQPFQNFLNELPLVDGGPASYVALHVGNCDDAFTLKLTGWTPLAMATGTPRFWLKSMSLCQAHAEAVLVEVETSEEEDELLELRMDNDQRHDQLRCFKLAACALAWMAGHSEFDFLSDENWHRGQLQSALPLEHVRSLEQPSLDIAVKYYASDGTIPNANLDAVDAVLVIRYIMDGNLVENPEQLRALVIFREAHPRLWFAMQFPPLKVLP